MEKRQELYKGKAKTVYATDDPNLLVMHFRDDVSAFDGVKVAKLELKGETNNKINAFVMGKLAGAGVPTHMVRVLNRHGGRRPDAGVLNLTYARKFSDQFSLGASAIVAIQRFEARGLDNFAPFTRTYVSTFNPSTGGQMPENLSDNGHDMSYGYGASVGFQWNPSDMFSFAAGYTTKMSMSEFDDYSDLFAEEGGFDMPSTWQVGVAFRPNDAWTLMFDVQDISYSDVKSVSNGIENLFNCPIWPGATDLEGCLGGRRGAGFGWEDMTVYKLGASWDYSDTWTWRAGFSTTDQPIPKSEMTFNILAPGVMEEHFTVGFTQKLDNGNEVNLSFMYAPEVEVKGPQNFDPSQQVTLKMQQVELELSYSWKR